MALVYLANKEVCSELAVDSAEAEVVFAVEDFGGFVVDGVACAQEAEVEFAGLDEVAEVVGGFVAEEVVAGWGVGFGPEVDGRGEFEGEAVDFDA